MRQLATGQNAAVFQQQIQQLESQRASLDTTVLNELIEQRLIAKEAEARGIAVTKADEDARIEKDFGASPQPTPSPDPSATPGPQVTPLPTADAYDRLKTVLGNIKVMNQAEFRQLVIRPEITSERLQDSFVKDVPPTELADPRPPHPARAGGRGQGGQGAARQGRAVRQARRPS